MDTNGGNMGLTNHIVQCGIRFPGNIPGCLHYPKKGWLPQPGREIPRDMTFLRRRFPRGILRESPPGSQTEWLWGLGLLPDQAHYPQKKGDPVILRCAPPLTVALTPSR